MLCFDSAVSECLPLSLCPLLSDCHLSFVSLQSDVQTSVTPLSAPPLHVSPLLLNLFLIILDSSFHSLTLFLWCLVISLQKLSVFSCWKPANQFIIGFTRAFYQYGSLPDPLFSSSILGVGYSAVVRTINFKIKHAI